MAGTYLAVPTPILDVIGWEDNATVFGGISFSAPIPLLDVSNSKDTDLAFPLPSISVTGVVGNYGVVILELPSIWAVIRGSANLVGDIALPFPSLSIVVTREESGPLLAFPTPVIDVTGLNGLAGHVILRSVGSISAGGVTGMTAQVAFKLAPPQIFATSVSTISLVLPNIAFDTEGTTGCIGQINFSLAYIGSAIQAAGSTPFVGNVSLTIAPRFISGGANGVIGKVVSISLSLKEIALAVAGGTGTLGVASLALPIQMLRADGYGPQIGDATLALPVLVLQATGRESSGANFSTIVMHTESNALSTFDNYKFNSFARFNGVYLGANDSGIFALIGATDDGVIIDAAARVGITDFGTSHLKRVDRCYVGYRTDGDMVLRVTTDDSTIRDYVLTTATTAGGIHGNHVRIGKGLAARYWQFEIQNRAGSDFELDIIEIKPTVLHRRIGGKDA